jgi:phospholipase/carboxylesterase
MNLDSELIQAEQAGSGHLMIVLHGLGDSREGYRWLPGVMHLPWLNYLLVNAPDEYYGGFSWFPYPGERRSAIKRSRELLVSLLDQQRAAGWATAQTFLFGFSQGCLMSVEVGLRYPHRLAGIVGISGWVDEPERQLAEQSPVAWQQRFLITHGVFDPLIPFAPAKACFAALKAGGLQIDWHEFPKEHTIYGESEMKVIRDFVCEAAKE